MTDTQLYLAIGVPVLFNGAMLAIINGNINARITSIEQRIASLGARFEILAGKVAEFSDRLARVEERLQIY